MLYCLQKIEVSTNSCFPPWVPKKHSQSTPKWLPKVTPEASRSQKMKIKSDARVGLQFRPNFGRLRSPTWDPKWTPKSLKNLTLASQGPPGTPKAAQRPPGSNFWTSWDPFWSHFEAARRPPGSHFGAVWGLFSNQFGDMLGHFRRLALTITLLSSNSRQN